VPPNWAQRQLWSQEPLQPHPASASGCIESPDRLGITSDLKRSAARPPIVQVKPVCRSPRDGERTWEPSLISLHPGRAAAYLPGHFSRPNEVISVRRDSGRLPDRPGDDRIPPLPAAQTRADGRQAVGEGQSAQGPEAASRPDPLAQPATHCTPAAQAASLPSLHRVVSWRAFQCG
jgi:hypothetical protein